MVPELGLLEQGMLDEMLDMLEKMLGRRATGHSRCVSNIGCFTAFVKNIGYLTTFVAILLESGQGHSEETAKTNSCCTKLFHVSKSRVTLRGHSQELSETGSACIDDLSHNAQFKGLCPTRKFVVLILENHCVS